MQFNKLDAIQQAGCNSTNWMQFNKRDAIQQAGCNSTSGMQFNKRDAIQQAGGNSKGMTKAPGESYMGRTFSNDMRRTFSNETQKHENPHSLFCPNCLEQSIKINNDQVLASNTLKARKEINYNPKKHPDSAKDTHLSPVFIP
ncbi:MAG: hypothetical protein OEM82_06430 [Acidobacteriota bacterium]|nr:hypothetical protein [Acidobacteriota bacterium]